MRSLSFFDLFVKIGLVYEHEEYGYTFSDFVLVLAETPEGIAVKDIKDAFSWLE
jgi:hypothetical protein